MTSTFAYFEGSIDASGVSSLRFVSELSGSEMSVLMGVGGGGIRRTSLLCFWDSS